MVSNSDNSEQETIRSSLWETVKIVLHALILALLIRLFLFQPFNIPSGSMKQTLLIGDYLFVSKFSYGYSKYSFFGTIDGIEGRVWGAKPKRGDVIVFKLPTDNSTDYIKRLIGLPGDVIQVKQGTLYINQKPVPKVKTTPFENVDSYGQSIKIPAFTETLPNGVKYTVLDSQPNGSYDNTQAYTVPEGHYFMMGDNRDNSTDSRALGHVGYVPYENIIGKAQIIFFSKGINTSGSFFSSIRWSRIFNSIQ